MSSEITAAASSSDSAENTTTTAVTTAEPTKKSTYTISQQLQAHLKNPFPITSKLEQRIQTVQRKLQKCRTDHKKHLRAKEMITNDNESDNMNKKRPLHETSTTTSSSSSNNSGSSKESSDDYDESNPKRRRLNSVVVSSSNTATAAGSSDTAASAESSSSTNSSSTASSTQRPQAADRGRRMLGFLKGHLQKSEKELQSAKSKIEKQKEIEQKVSEQEKQKKLELAKEELKHYEELAQTTMKDLEEAEKELSLLEKLALALCQLEQMSKFKLFIKTETKPPIYYVPKKHNDKTRQLLAKSNEEFEEKAKQVDELISSNSNVFSLFSSVNNSSKNNAS